MSFGYSIGDTTHYKNAKLAVTTFSLVTLMLAGCAVGPDYQRPAAFADGAEPAFKEASAWKPAQPGQADVTSTWWTVYRDPQLNALVEQALKANQSLKQVQSQYRQAAALVPAAQAAYFPTLGLSASAARGEAYSQGVSSTHTTHAWSFQARREPEFLGRARRSVEQAAATAWARAPDLAP